MYRAMNNLREQKGFTLIELLIVVAIIGILAAIAIPGYLGMQEKSRKASLQRSAAAAVAELQAWLQASRSTPTAVEVDSSGDGSVGAGDVNNSLLAANGVNSYYVNSKNNRDWSPWDGTKALWHYDTSGLTFPTTFGFIVVTSVGNNIIIQGYSKGDAQASPTVSKVISSD